MTTKGTQLFSGGAPQGYIEMPFTSAEINKLSVSTLIRLGADMMALLGGLSETLDTILFQVCANFSSLRSFYLPTLKA
jgi:hypothetical protein